MGAPILAMQQQDICNLQTAIAYWQNAGLNADEALGAYGAAQKLSDQLARDLGMDPSAVRSALGLAGDTTPTDLDAIVTEISAFASSQSIIAATPQTAGLLPTTAAGCLVIIEMQQEISNSILSSTQAQTARKQQLQDMQNVLQAQRNTMTAGQTRKVQITPSGDAGDCGVLLAQMAEFGLIPNTTAVRIDEKDSSANYLGPTSGLFNASDTNPADYRMSDDNFDGVYDMTADSFDYFLVQIQNMLSATDQAQSQNMDRYNHHVSELSAMADFLSKVIAAFGALAQQIFSSR